MTRFGDAHAGSCYTVRPCILSTPTLCHVKHQSTINLLFFPFLENYLNRNNHVSVVGGPALN